MWVVIFVVVAVIVFGAAERGGELYMHDPGPTEYLVSLLYMAALLVGAMGFFKKL